MSLHMSRAIPIWGISFLIALCSDATAQWQPATTPAPGNCVCTQPVVQPIYRSVPVTTYQPVRQTVQRPVVETEYEDRNVTEYRPVTEQRTSMVPTVAYEDVTEYRTVQRDMGSFQSWQEWKPQVAPWQYDGRPTLFGWMNRTGYAIRSAFTPPVRTRRQYVPNVVTESIPVTRRVARQASQQVTYNVTTMQPFHTTRKVAVNKVRYETAEIVTHRPVTVMQQVPVGSRVAYVTTGMSATALAPVADPVGSAQNPPQSRTANSQSDGFNRVDRAVPPPRDERDDTPPDSFNFDSRLDRPSVPGSFETVPPGHQVIQPRHPLAQRRFRIPSAVRVNRLVSRSGYRVSGPILVGSAAPSPTDAYLR